MKKLLAPIFVFLAATFGIEDITHGCEITTQEILHNAIDNCRMMTAHNSLYGFDFPYPEFFNPESDSDSIARYCYRNRTNMIIEAIVIKDISTLCRHSNILSRSPESIVWEAQCNGKESAFPDYRFHAKAVKSGHLWVVCRLIYEKNFEKSVGRIKNTIDYWSP